MVDPIRYLQATGRSGTQTWPNAKLNLHWRPDSESAELSGNVGLKQITTGN